MRTGLIFFGEKFFFAGTGVLTNAVVMVDNGGLRTAADAGLSGIWAEIYGRRRTGGQ